MTMKKLDMVDLGNVLGLEARRTAADSILPALALFRPKASAPAWA